MRRGPELAPHHRFAPAREAELGVQALGEARALGLQRAVDFPRRARVGPRPDGTIRIAVSRWARDPAHTEESSRTAALGGVVVHRNVPGSATKTLSLLEGED
jgi:hypothetical protein